MGLGPSVGQALPAELKVHDALVGVGQTFGGADVTQDLRAVRVAAESFVGFGI